MVDLSDERRHAPGDDQLWTESWCFEVVAPDASWGIHARLGLYPNMGAAWWWALVVRRDEPLLLARDHTLALPRGKSFEVRGDGLWADLTCHEPMQRWQVNFEGIALALDDPNDVHFRERGDRVPIEFEFEWESVGTPRPIGALGYGLFCTSHGELKIGTPDNVLSLDDPAPGYRTHLWDPPPVSSPRDSAGQASGVGDW